VPPSTESSAPARGLARRLFEVTSVVPLSVWVVLHVAAYARTAGAPASSAPAEPGRWWSWSLVLEALLVWVPLAYHAIYGSLLLLRRETRRSMLPSERALDTAERVTGVFLLVALAVHVYRFRLPVLLGERYPEHIGYVLFAELSRTTRGLPLVAALELALVFAAAFHVAYGSYRLARARLPLRGQRESWLRALALALGVSLSLLGALTVIRVATGG
jgi:succinate dehydrogenase / fumarate reductase cytochrome b subunit